MVMNGEVTHADTPWWEEITKPVRTQTKRVESIPPRTLYPRSQEKGTENSISVDRSPDSDILILTLYHGYHNACASVSADAPRTVRGSDEGRQKLTGRSSSSSRVQITINNNIDSRRVFGLHKQVNVHFLVSSSSSRKVRIELPIAQVGNWTHIYQRFQSDDSANFRFHICSRQLFLDLHLWWYLCTARAPTIH